MALVKCRECNKEVSSEANQCPGCGYTRIASDYKKAQNDVLLNSTAFKITTGISTVILMIGLGSWILSSEGNSEQTPRLSDCVKKGALYFAEINSYPILSDGRNALTVADERCKNNPTAFDGLKK